MESINKQLDSLFEYWKAKSKALKDADEIVTDGIMRKFITTDTINNTPWKDRNLRIAFLVKDNPDGAHDTRNWLEKEDNIQLTTYFELSFDTMARVNAISSIRWEQIDFENFIIEDVLEKEQRLVTLYFGERTKEILLKLKDEREKEGINSPFVFITRDGNQIGVNTLREWCTKIGKAIGVETLHPHDFRHSSATLRKNAGMTLEDVSSLLSHQDTSTTLNFYIKADKKSIGEKFRSIKI